MIVAAGLNGAIGKDNALLWHLPADLKYFKETTKGKSIVMGRSTYESVGRPLPHRRNIVLSRNPDLHIQGVEVVRSLEQAFELTRMEEEVMVVGGAEIYRLAMPLADRIYLTRIHLNPEADAFFPDLDPMIWNMVHEDHREKDEKNAADMDFQIWERI